MKIESETLDCLHQYKHNKGNRWYSSHNLLYITKTENKILPEDIKWPFSRFGGTGHQIIEILLILLSSALSQEEQSV